MFMMRVGNPMPVVATKANKIHSLRSRKDAVRHALLTRGCMKMGSDPNSRMGCRTMGSDLEFVTPISR